MKQLRILSLLCCAVLLLLSLSACTETTKLNKIYEGTFDGREPELNKATAITLSPIEQSDNGFLLTLKDKTYQVYDMVAEKTVLTYKPADNETVRFEPYELNGARVFLLETQISDNSGNVTTYKTSMYSAAGTLLESEESKIAQPAITTKLDLLVFNDKVYRASGTDFVKVGDVAALGNHLDDYNQKMGDRYYSFDKDCFSVYAADGTFYDIYVYENADKTTYNLLQNGNVLIQYLYVQPNTAEKYDYIEGGAKYTLKTYLWQAEKKAAKSVSFAYQIDEIVQVTPEAREDSERLYGMPVSEKLENIAYLSPIKDQRLQTQIVVTLKNDAKVDWNVSETYKGIYGVPFPVADGVFAYETVAGQTFIIDKNGKLLKDASSVKEMNGNFLVAGGRLYDTRFNLLTAYEKEGCTLEHLYSTCAILKDGDKYIRYEGSTKKKIDNIRSTDTVVFHDEYYQVTATNGETTYYAPNGTQVYQAKTALTPVHDYDNKMLFSYEENGKTLYVLFSLN